MNKTERFWTWILANSAGWLIFMGLFWVVSGLLSRLGAYFPIFPVSVLLVGFALAVLQGTLLRRWLPLRWSIWLLGGTAGFAAGEYLHVWAILLDRTIVNNLPNGPLLEWDPLIGGALLGLALGIGQSLAWRLGWGERLVWILATAAGWAAGLFLADVAAFFLFDFAPDLLRAGFGRFLLDAAITGVTFSLVTGISLVWLVGRSPLPVGGQAEASAT